MFLAASLSYLVGTAVAGVLGLKVGRKVTSVCALVVVAAGVGVLVWPGQRSTALQSIPGLLCIGAGSGGNEASTNPIIASITDLVYPQSEGSAFALVDMCFAFGFAAGPLLAAALFASDVAVM